ncbi:MAG: helix-turn-helix domain-containing protein [Bacteroidia bacterium]
MAAKFPTTEVDMLQISGVSHNKMGKYGEAFIEQILDYITRQNQKQNAYQAKGSTFLVTYDLYRKGHSVEEIAEMRSLHLNTIYSHLIYLYEKDYEIDLTDHVNMHEIERIAKALKEKWTQFWSQADL